MNKTLLLASAAAVFAFTFEANACDLKPYISAKITAASVSNKVKMTEAEYDNEDPEYTDIYDMFRDDMNDNTWGFSLAAGIKKELEKGAVRAEFEFSRKQPTSSYITAGYGEMGGLKFKTQIHSYMINAYYDFNTDSAFTPYIGGGIGLAKTKLSIAYGEESDSHTNFAWQIGGGIAYAVNDNVSVDVGYRYVDYGKFDKITRVEDVLWWTEAARTSVDTTANELYAGIRYTF